MKATRYTSARRTQRREAREQRIRAGAPSVRHDWRCPLCKQWYSKYRSRNLIHLRCCEKSHAKLAALEKKRRTQTPLPSPDPFTPRSTPDSTSALQPGPSRVTQSPGTWEVLEPTEDTMWDQQLWDDDIPDIVPQDLEDAPVSGDEGVPGKPNIVF